MELGCPWYQSVWMPGPCGLAGLGLPGSREEIIFQLDWASDLQFHSRASSDGFHRFLSSHTRGRDEIKDQ